MKKTVLSVILAAVMGTGAFAHSKQEQTVPADKSVVENVETIEIRFDSPMRVTAVSLTGPSGDVPVERATGLEPVTEFRATPPASMASGNYTVEWRGLAEDGHPMQGRFEFEITR